MRKIAVLCPSRMRPELLRRAVDSWKLNSVASDIIFGFQEDDEALTRNVQIAEDTKAMHLHFPNIGLAAKVNELCKAMPDYAGYMVLNDDQIIHTPRWDRIILDCIATWEKEHGHRYVIPHWRDGIHDDRLPQGFMTQELLQVMGTYYPEGYMRHLFTDNYFLFLGKVCGLLRFIPDIYIEHLHFVNGKAPVDANYAETQTKDAYDRDGKLFEEWALKKGYPLTEIIKGRIEEAVTA